MTFPNLKQKENSKTCGPNCLVNIYTHYGIKTTLQKILDDLNVAADESTYVPQLARHVLKSKLKTTLVSSNTFTLSAEWKNKPKTIVIEELKKWLAKNSKSEWLTDGLFTLYYLQEGGELVIANITTQVIDTLLQQNNVLIVCIEESWLWGKRKLKGAVEYDAVKGMTAGHCIVVYGQKGNKYLISDPYPTQISGRDGLYSIDKDTLVVSTLIWSKHLLAIKK